MFAALWAYLVFLTGGFAFDFLALRLSSTSPRNPAIVAAIAGIAAWVLATPGRRARALAEGVGCLAQDVSHRLSLSGRHIRVLAPLIAVSVAVMVVTTGISKGTAVAGGSDSYGYVSQAHLWATGRLRDEQPLMGSLTPPLGAALAPLGYRPARDGSSIVPVYAPGLPILMAVFERLGGRRAVFYVVPLLGGLAVYATYLLGVGVSSHAAGVCAAVLLATSPTFLYVLVQPLSDLPVTAWWALSLALLPVKRRDAALGAGVSAGLAILTRPNLVPTLVVPGVLLWRSLAADRSVLGQAAQRTLLFLAGLLPACVAVAFLNNVWYGSPLSNGYGPLDYLYSWHNFWPNLARYPRWLFDSQSPIVLLGLAAPFVGQLRVNGHPGRYDPRLMSITWLAFAAIVLGCYVFYFVFDAWWTLRFLLPALPPLLALTAAVLVTAVTRFFRNGRQITIVVVVGLLAAHGLAYANDHGVFNLAEGETKYFLVGRYVIKRLPDNAILVSVAHSGSARYYSGRLTINYSEIPPDKLDSLLDELRTLGYHPYFVLEGPEENEFRQRFGGYSSIGHLDWLPMAMLRHPAFVRIFDPDDRPRVRRRIEVIDVH